jgi:hypothetical protein
MSSSEASSSWSVKPASSAARKQWEQAKAREPDLMADLSERLRLRPLDRRDNPQRLGPLKGKLKDKKVGHKRLPQWQFEVTSSGRVWFCPDKSERIVWVTKVDLAHPKETEYNGRG